MKIEVVEKIQNILWGIIGTSLVLANFLDNDIFIGILLVITIIALILKLILRVKFWKCPYCGKDLGRDVGNYCGNCGKRIK